MAYNSNWKEYLVVWHASTATNRYIYGQFVDEDGNFFGTRFIISPPVGNNMYPDVAYNPTRNEYLVVYMVETTTSGVYGIYGMQLDAYGAPLGTERCFATSPPTYSYWHPAVAYSSVSAQYLVTWQKDWGTAYKGIEVRSLSGDGYTTGTILEVTGLQANVAPSQPDVDYTLASDEFLVVWQRWYDSSQSDHDVMGQRIDLDGGAHLEGGNFSIISTSLDEGAPAVASVSPIYGLGEYLVVYVFAYESSAYIAGQLMSDIGTMDTWITISPHGGTIPAVAGNLNTQEFLVAWKYGSSIQARTVSISGALGPWAETTPSGSYPDWPAVAAGSLSDYLVTHHEQRPGYPYDVFGYLWGIRTYLPIVQRGL